MFSQVVQLYRFLKFPSIEAQQFTYSGSVDPEVVALLNAMDALPSHFGVFREKEIQRTEIDIEFALPTTEYGRFYVDIDEFVRKVNSLERGIIPEQYYIQDLDFYSQDIQICEPIARLQDYCEFIRLLTQLASDASTRDESGDKNRLVFILSADGKSPAKTITFRTQIEQSLLEFQLAHPAFLRALLAESHKDKVHIEERCMVLRNSIAEILSEADSTVNQFAFLAKSWNDVLVKYRHNFQAFLSQYSFEKVRKDIATAEIDHATKLSGVLSDIAGKLLALPVSFAGIILLRKASDIIEFTLGAVGLISVSIIFVMVIVNQWLQVNRLRASFTFIFSQYDSTLKQFPKKFQVPIENAKEAINKQSKFLQKTFLLFGVFALLPIIFILLVSLEVYFPSLFQNCSLLRVLLFGGCKHIGL